MQIFISCMILAMEILLLHCGNVSVNIWIWENVTDVYLKWCIVIIENQAQIKHEFGISPLFISKIKKKLNEWSISMKQTLNFVVAINVNICFMYCSVLFPFHLGHTFSVDHICPTICERKSVNYKVQKNLHEWANKLKSTMITTFIEAVSCHSTWALVSTRKFFSCWWNSCQKSIFISLLCVECLQLR